MLTKIVLWVTGLSLGLYGAACLFSPELAAGYIGYQLIAADTTIEVIAMYGGLQVGFGLFCIFSALSSTHTKSGIIAVFLVMGGLAVSRAFGIASVSGDPSEYTYGAVVYESLTTVMALLALRQSKQA